MTIILLCPFLHLQERIHIKWMFKIHGIFVEVGKCQYLELFHIRSCGHLLGVVEGFSSNGKLELITLTFQTICKFPEF